MKKIMSVLTVFLLIAMILTLVSCGGKNAASANAPATTVNQQAQASKLAEEATKMPEPETQPAASGSSALSVSGLDKLVGEWNDVDNPDRFAKITKDGDKYTYQDNDGTYPGTPKDNVLVIKISDAENDTAEVFIEAETGNLITNYQGDIYKFTRKLGQ